MSVSAPALLTFGTSEISEQSFWQHRLQERVQNSEVILTVPVVVHVVHNDPSSSPNPFRSSHISVNQILSQIRVLNEDFRKKINTNGYSNNPLAADIGIEFCLASTDPQGLATTGINYIYHPQESWTASQEDEYALKSLSVWPTDKYLNIWVTNLQVDRGFGYARYPRGTQFADLEYEPDYAHLLDGIVIDHRVFGTNGSAVFPYNLGRTTTHEVGHWLGLRHLWGDVVCGGDYVEDTPEDQGPNLDFDCNDSSFCTGTVAQDMTSNYLDFSPDACMNLFTKGQKERMLQCLLQSPRRRGLFESEGCSGFTQDLYINTFPNPCSGSLTIDFFWPGKQKVYLEFYSVQGVRVWEQTLETAKAVSVPLDVSQFPNGVYVLKISSLGSGVRDAVRMRRIVIQN